MATDMKRMFQVPVVHLCSPPPFRIADAKVTQADFDKYDADKSKSLSKVEFSKWAEAKTTPPASAPGQ